MQICGDNNQIHLNSFLASNIDGCSDQNSFDNGTHGNYWALNALCNDSDYDGVCDDPFDCSVTFVAKADS